MRFEVSTADENSDLLRYLHGQQFNTLRTGAFKLFKCMFPGSKQFKSTFILCFYKNL